MTRLTFEKIFAEVIIEEIKKKKYLLQYDGPSLLIVNGQSSRLSQKMFQFSMENNLDVVCIPSHVSHILSNACAKNHLHKFNSAVYNNNYLKRTDFLYVLKSALSKGLFLEL
jgi:hypothetical protein